MTWMIEYRLNRTAFNIATRIHHVHTVSNTRNDPQVMSDEHDSCSESLLHSLNDFKYLGLHGDVKCGCWFISDQHLRVVSNCHCNNNSLTHSARKFVRILASTFIWLRDPNDLQQLNSLLLGIMSIQVLVGLNHFNYLITNSMHRVQCRQRVLEHHCQRLTSNRTNCFALGSDQLFAI